MKYLGFWTSTFLEITMQRQCPQILKWTDQISNQYHIYLLSILFFCLSKRWIHGRCKTGDITMYVPGPKSLRQVLQERHI